MAKDLILKEKLIPTLPTEIPNNPKPEDKILTAINITNKPKLKEKESIPSPESQVNTPESPELLTIDEKYNTTELIFSKIIEDIKSQVKTNISANLSIDSLLQARDMANSKHNENEKVGTLTVEEFSNTILIEAIKQNPSPELIIQLSESTKKGIGFQHDLSQKIMTIRNVLDILKQNKIIISQSKINQFFNYYDTVEKAVTNSQKELATFQQPYNGYTLGYHQMVTNPTKYVTDNFRANPLYNPGDIIQNHEEGFDSIQIGAAAERKVNSAMSEIEGMVMVVAGPNFSIMDTESKIDSLSFYSQNEINKKDKERIMELTYDLAYASYQESLLEDYQKADPNKIRKHEVVPKAYINALKDIDLSEQGATIYLDQFDELNNKYDTLFNQIQLNSAKIEELKSKSSKKDNSTLKSILKIKKANEVLSEELKTVSEETFAAKSTVNEKQKQINLLKAEAQGIYANYNPQGLAIPLALSPYGQIEIYQDGLKTNFKTPNYSDYADPKDAALLKQELDSLLIKYKIRVNSIQIKQNVHTPKVKDAIASGKITGAIGINQSYYSASSTLKEAIEVSLNLDDTPTTLARPLRD